MKMPDEIAKLVAELKEWDIYLCETQIECAPLRKAANALEAQQRTIERLSAPVSEDELQRAMVRSIADEWGGVNTHPVDCLIQERKNAE